MFFSTMQSFKKKKIQDICDLQEYEGSDIIYSKHCMVIKTYKLFTAERKQKMEMQITLKNSVNGGSFHNWY